MEKKMEKTLCSLPLEADGDFLSRRIDLNWEEESEILSLSGNFDLESRCSTSRLNINNKENDFSIDNEDSFVLRCFSNEKLDEASDMPEIQLRNNEALKKSLWGRRISKDIQISGKNAQNVPEARRLSKTLDKTLLKLQNRRSSLSCPDFTEIEVFGIGKQKPHSAKLIAENEADSCEDWELEERLDSVEMKLNLDNENKRNTQTSRAKKHNLKDSLVSVYSQKFNVNSRFLSKSYYPSGYWKPKTSVPACRISAINVKIEKGKGTGINRKSIDSELEEIRKKFNTKKLFRSWVWEPEISVTKTNLRKNLVVLGPKLRKKDGSAKQPKGTSLEDQLNTSQSLTNKARNIQRSNLDSDKRNRTSSVTLPTICNSSLQATQTNQNYKNAKREKFPNLLNDGLVSKYKKQHDELIRENEKNKKVKFPKKSFGSLM